LRADAEDAVKNDKANLATAINTLNTTLTNAGLAGLATAAAKLTTAADNVSMALSPQHGDSTSIVDALKNQTVVVVDQVPGTTATFSGGQSGTVNGGGSGAGSISNMSESVVW
jgi:hypothetical protein